MAALPYMQLYVADYLADTMHLDVEEHGAYLLLMMNYWQTGKPLRKSRLQRIAKVPSDRWASVEQVLSEFFQDDGEFWRHKRLDADLRRVEQEQKQRVAAGKASAESRKREKIRNGKKLNELTTTDEHPRNDRSTGSQRITDTDTEQTTASPSLRSGEESSASADNPSKQGNGKAPPCPHDKIIDAYHEELPELRPVQVWNDQRRKLLQTRWREKPERQDVEYWRRYFRFVRESDFLMGLAEPGPGKKTFSADLEWLVRPTNFAKVVEGKYHDAS